MGVVQAARLFVLKWVWLATGLQAAGRALVRALSSPDEGVRTIAGMFLVQAGARAVPLVEEALGRRESLPMLLLIAGDIGASSLEPQLRHLTADPDPRVAKAALDSLRTIAAQHTAVPQQNG